MRRLAAERLLVRQHLVEHRTDGEDVAAVIDRLPGDLLWRHVVGRAHHHADLGQVRSRRARDAEVEDLHVPRFAADHQVRGLDVAMDDAALVRVGEALADVGDELDPAADRERRPAMNQLAERLAGDVLHRDERLSLVCPDVVDGDDVRMLEARGDLRLANEALADLGVVDAQQLDRDEAIDRGIEREIEHAHPAMAETVPNLITADGRRLCHRGGGFSNGSKL